MGPHPRGCVLSLGTTVFLTTHYLEEADALCDRVFIIDHGVIVAQGTPDELKRRISGDVVTLQVNGAEGAGAWLLAALPVVREVTVAEDGALRLNVDHGAEALPGAAARARRRGGHHAVDQVVAADAGRRVPDDDRAVAAGRFREPTAEADAGRRRWPGRAGQGGSR